MRARSSLSVVVLASMLVLAGVAQARSHFGLEEVLSSPFPTSLVAAPHHGKIAWVQNAEGRRNVWVAAAPGYEARQVTSYAEDDGQEIGQLSIGPGGNHVVFVRGGAPNRAGEIPNPTSAAEGAEQEIWIVAADGSEEPRKLAAGTSPAISPDGRTIAFRKDGQIWTVPSLASGDAEPERLATIRGTAGSLRWSPDGRQLAFLSDRDDHAFVGVYSFGDEAVRYLDPSLATDQEPAWSPDGTHIAFLRVLNERQRLPFAPRRSAIPWSLRVVDVGTGQGREVFRVQDGVGSAFREISAENQIFWAEGDRLVFPWERDGWTHLYSIGVGGGSPRLLTPGEGEVEHAVLSPDRSEVIFSSNRRDIDRRHLWRVSVAGGTPRALTSGTGIEWSPVVAGDGSAVAYLASNARTPAHAVVQVEGGEPRPLAPDTLPADFPTEALVVPEPVVFSATDGKRIHGQLFLPSEAATSPRPAVLFFHGGSRRQMLLGWHYMGYYHHAYALNQYLASRGYVVLSVNYRSGTGYGMEFREALDYGARGASEFRDVLGAGLYLRSREDVDPDRIALWGGSYGGYLTALGLARASDLFAAGVDIHGVHDWNVVIQNFVPSYDAAERDAFARLAFESSPMASIESWRSPVLLIHGDDDRNVPFRESVDLAEALARQGVTVEQLVFPDEVHGFLLHRNWVAAFEAAASFLDRHLDHEPPSPSTSGGGPNQGDRER